MDFTPGVMSLQRSLSNGWWNKLKTNHNQTADFKASKMPSIFSHAETIPNRFSNDTKTLSLAVKEKYLEDKGFADGFQLPKEQVNRILKANLINQGEIEAVKLNDGEGEDFGVEGKPPNAKFLVRLRNPPFNNSTTEGGVDVLSDPAVISHVDQIYSDLNTGIKIVKNKGGRGAGGGRGVEMTFKGKALSELTPEELPEAQKSIAVLKKVSDNATGKVARRINADLKKLEVVVKAVVANQSVKKVAFATAELKEAVVSGTESVNSVFDEAIGKLSKKTAGKQMAVILEKVKEKVDLRATAEALLDSLIADALKKGSKKADVAEVKEKLEEIKAGGGAVVEALKKEGEDDDEEDDDEEDDGEPEARGGGGATIAGTIATEPAELLRGDTKLPYKDISELTKDFFVGKHTSTKIRIANSLDIENPEGYGKKGLIKKILMVVEERMKSRGASVGGSGSAPAPASSKSKKKSGGGGGGRTISLDV